MKKMDKKKQHEREARQRVLARRTRLRAQQKEKREQGREERLHRNRSQPITNEELRKWREVQAVEKLVEAQHQLAEFEQEVQRRKDYANGLRENP